MRRLLEMDLHDYDGCARVFYRPSARAVILRDSARIALVYSERARYYNFPAGAFIREFGSVLRLVSLDEAIRANSAFETGDFFDETMIRREAKALQLLKAALSG